MFYALVLLAHSWLRWLVLIAGTAILALAVRRWASGAAWDGRDTTVQRAFIRILDLQFLLGLVMYLFLSPLSRAGWADLGAAMENPVLRFYTVEHIFGMFVAVSIAHGGLMSANKLEPALRPRRIAVVFAVWLVVTVLSIPWPGLAYARPLFRL